MRSDHGRRLRSQDFSVAVEPDSIRRERTRRRAVSVEAHSPRAAATGGRRGRPDRAQPRGSPERIDAAAGDRREHARRQWRARRGAGHALDAGRLHAVHGGRHQSGGQSEPLSQPTYDPFRDFIPISIIAKVYLVLVASSKVEANSVQELMTLRQRQPRQAQLCLDRSRHPGASRHGIVQDDDQDRHHPGLVSRHRAGDDRHRCGRRRRHVHRSAVGHGAGERRQGEAAGGRLARALER